MTDFKKLFFILGIFNLKTKFSLLFIIATVMLILDFLSIGSVFPLVLSVLDKEINLKFLDINFENIDTNYLLSLCLIFFVLKNILSIFFVIISQKYLWDFYKRSSNFLLNHEIKKRFEEFYLTNSSLALRNIREVTVGFKNYLDATVTLISEYAKFTFIWSRHLNV